MPLFTGFYLLAAVNHKLLIAFIHDWTTAHSIIWYGRRLTIVLTLRTRVGIEVSSTWSRHFDSNRGRVALRHGPVGEIDRILRIYGDITETKMGRFWWIDVVPRENLSFSVSCEIERFSSVIKFGCLYWYFTQRKFERIFIYFIALRKNDYKKLYLVKCLVVSKNKIKLNIYIYIK